MSTLKTIKRSLVFLSCVSAPPLSSGVQYWLQNEVPAGREREEEGVSLGTRKEQFATDIFIFPLPTLRRLSFLPPLSLSLLPGALTRPTVFNTGAAHAISIRLSKEGEGRGCGCYFNAVAFHLRK